MAAIFGVLLLVAAAVARVPMEVGSDVTVQDLTAFDYHNKIGIKRAQAIEAVETDIINDPSRIVGGSPANLGQFPYQVCIFMALYLNLDLYHLMLSTSSRYMAYRIQV